MTVQEACLARPDAERLPDTILADKDVALDTLAP